MNDLSVLMIRTYDLKCTSKTQKPKNNMYECTISLLRLSLSWAIAFLYWHVWIFAIFYYFPNTFDFYCFLEDLKSSVMSSSYSIGSLGISFQLYRNTDGLKPTGHSFYLWVYERYTHTWRGHSHAQLEYDHWKHYHPQWTQIANLMQNIWSEKSICSTSLDFSY